MSRPSPKQVVAALLVAGVVILLGRALTGGLALLDVGSRSVEPNFPEALATEPPPDFGPTPSLDERRAFWMSMFLTGDADDASWALRQIRRDGDASRAAVVAAALRSMASNSALVQHALELCISDPRASDRAFALVALESKSEQSNIRAATLLGLLGDAAAGTERRIADLAVERSFHTPRHAFTALERIGTEEAAEAIFEALPRLPPGYRGWAYIALGEMGLPSCTAYLRARFDAIDDLTERASIAEGLVRAGDDTPLPWLREQTERLGDGSDAGEAMLRVLAQAADPSARAMLTRRLTDPVEGEERREEAAVLLRNYAIGDVDEALRFATRRRPRGAETENPLKVRIAALESRVLMDAPGAEDELLTLLFAAGEGGRDDREVAALAVGRLRRPDLAQHVAAGLQTLAPDDARLRSWFLRALILCGDVAYARTVVAAMAGDHGGFGHGGLAFDVYMGFEGADADMKPALGAAAVEALTGRYGEVSGHGLQHLILAAGWAGDRSAAPAVEPFALHDVREIRDAAVTVLPEIGRRESMQVLRRLWRRKIDAGQREALRRAMQLLHFAAE